MACAAVGASCAIALYLFWQLPANGVLRDPVYTWIESGPFKVNMAFQVDALTAVMLLIVTGIGFLIHIYSLGYMAHDEGFVRFFIYLGSDGKIIVANFGPPQPLQRSGDGL